MSPKADTMKWVDSSNLIREENLLVAAGLRDRLQMSHEQIVDFLNTHFLPSGGAKQGSLQVTLTHARHRKTSPYDRLPSIEQGSEEERLCFRLIEERTGLMAQDIVAMYGLRTPAHQRHVEKYFDQIAWTDEKLRVLGGLLKYCCEGDAQAAMGFMRRWLGDSYRHKYMYPSSMISTLKRHHPFFRDYLSSEKTDDDRRAFETLLRSQPNTADWSTDSIAEEYQKHAIIDWSDKENQFLWAGLLRYCGLSWEQARVFLERWFERELPQSVDHRSYAPPYAAIQRRGLSIQDIAPIDSPLTSARRDAFERLLHRKRWTIKDVQEGAASGAFSDSIPEV